MSETKNVVLKLIDAVNAHDADGIAAVLSSDFAYHADESNQDAAWLVNLETKTWGAYPDIRIMVLDSVAEGDRVALRALHEGTLKDSDYRMETYFNPVYRIEDGKVAEMWVGSSRNSLDPDGSKLRQELANNPSHHTA